MSSLASLVSFVKDDTVRITAVIQDFDGSLLDPTSDSVVIYDPNGVNMGVLPTTRVSLGTFSVDYVIPALGPAGVWKCTWKVLIGTYPIRETIYFMVGEG